MSLELESKHDHEPPLEEIIDIRDPAIDVEAVMARIRAGIRRRRQQAEADGVDLKSFAAGLDVAQAPSLGHETFYNLHRLSASYNKINVGMELTASTLPVVGPLWQKVRRSSHQLVLFYVNKVAGKQVVFNKYVVQALTALVKNLAEENGRMKAELEGLQARIAALEAALERRERE
ncbi:MAG: hypothetical protein ACE5H9_07360 [Anaerolineae bacterium]